MTATTKNGKSDSASEVVTQPIDCTNSVAGLNMPGVFAKKANLRKAWKHERKLCREIKRAHQAGKRKRVEHFTRLYLMSLDTKYVATVMANRALKSHRKVPVGQLSKIAENLDPWRGSAEAVTVHFKPKEGNEYDFRPIMDFGIESRALQYLVRAALKAQASIHPRQFSTRGGPPAAGKAVVDALAAGYDWVAEVDIANCYPSFDGEKVQIESALVANGLGAPITDAR